MCIIVCQWHVCSDMNTLIEMTHAIVTYARQDMNAKVLPPAFVEPVLRKCPGRGREPPAGTGNAASRRCQSSIIAQVIILLNCPSHLRIYLPGHGAWRLYHGQLASLRLAAGLLELIRNRTSPKKAGLDRIRVASPACKYPRDLRVRWTTSAPSSPQLPMAELPATPHGLL